jgi:ribosomal protein S18 acetylase RimI-like enzyme
MTIAVRRANNTDAELFSTLNIDVQAIHAEALPWRFKPPGPDSFPPSAAAELLAKPETIVLVAEMESLPVGYAYAEVMRLPETPFRHAYDVVHVHHISVRLQNRRQGVGDALIAAMRSAADEIGIALLTLDVWTFNDGARAFFRRQGFKPYIERLWNRR